MRRFVFELRHPPTLYFALEPFSIHIFTSPRPTSLLPLRPKLQLHHRDRTNLIGKKETRVQPLTLTDGFRSFLSFLFNFFFFLFRLSLDPNAKLTAGKLGL